MDEFKVFYVDREVCLKITRKYGPLSLTWVVFVNEWHHVIRHL